MHWLHLSHHTGCAADLQYAFNKLGHDIDTFLGINEYNIGPTQATDLWRKHHAMFEQYDGIVTSDTAPLSRILLQNNWSKPLIIWVCTRFDYVDQATNDCGFPDPGYYEQFQAALHKPNVRVIAYTKFEYLHARDKGISMGDVVIKPSGMGAHTKQRSLIPPSVNKAETFFIPPYHNDTHLLDLQGMCQSLGVKAYRGRYAGPDDLRGFRGIIHIPYAWSNLALFENWHRGLTYLIPGREMLLKLAETSEFFWSPPFLRERLADSEWYCPEHVEMFGYFDSWEELKDIVAGFGGSAKRIRERAREHAIKQLSRWKNVLGSF